MPGERVQAKELRHFVFRRDARQQRPTVRVGGGDEQREQHRNAQVGDFRQRLEECELPDRLVQAFHLHKEDGGGRDGDGGQKGNEVSSDAEDDGLLGTDDVVQPAANESRRDGEYREEHANHQAFRLAPTEDAGGIDHVEGHDGDLAVVEEHSRQQVGGDVSIDQHALGGLQDVRESLPDGLAGGRAATRLIGREEEQRQRKQHQPNGGNRRRDANLLELLGIQAEHHLARQPAPSQQTGSGQGKGNQQRA